MAKSKLKSVRVLVTLDVEKEGLPLSISSGVVLSVKPGEEKDRESSLIDAVQRAAASSLEIGMKKYLTPE